MSGLLTRASLLSCYACSPSLLARASLLSFYASSQSLLAWASGDLIGSAPPCEFTFMLHKFAEPVGSCFLLPSR
ncbi:hypothetical protein CRG98_049264, partial [Punica granatum]